MKKRNVKAKLKQLMIGALSAVVVAGTAAGLSDIAMANRSVKPSNQVDDDGKLVVEKVDVGSPYNYSVFTQVYSRGNHLEGTVAAKEVNLDVELWGYNDKQNVGIPNQSYIADSAGGMNLKFQNGGWDTNLVIGDKVPAFSGIDLAQVVSSIFGNDAQLASFTIADTEYMKASIDAQFAWLASQSAAYKTMVSAPDDGLIVYSLTDAGQINDTLVKDIQAYAEAGNQVVINVPGKVIWDQKNWNAGSAYAWWSDNITWNFYEAEELHLSNNTYGTVYALNATVENTNWIVGHLFCKEFRQNGEVHAPNRSERPENPSPSPSPSEEPSPSPSEEPSPSPSPTPVTTPSPSPTPTPVTTPTPTPTPTPVTTPTPTPTPVTTPTPTPMLTPDPTPYTVNVPERPEEPQVLGRRRPRIVTIDDEATPLADGSILGSDRRPQTSDESDLWTVAFLASLSGLTAWLLAGKKRS